MPKGFPDNTPLEDMTEEQRTAYWKYHSRKHEQTLRDLGDVEELKRNAQAWTDHEKNRDKNQESLDTQIAQARAEGKAEGRNEAMRESGLNTVKDLFKAKVGDRRTEEELDEFLEDVDLARFLKSDHTIDTDKIDSKVKLFAPIPEDKNPRPPHQQRRSTSTHQGHREGEGQTGVAAGKALFEEFSGKKG